MSPICEIYSYDTLGRMTAADDRNGVQLFYLSYNDEGRRTALCPNGSGGNQGMCTRYGYDPAGRLTAQNLLGASGTGIALGGYNPAGQIGTRQTSNDAYGWAGHGNTDRSYVVNGLNQVTSAGGGTLAYDSRGNLTNMGGNSYSYDSFNRLGEYNGGLAAGRWLYYDALGRLEWSNYTQTRFGSCAQFVAKSLMEGRVPRPVEPFWTSPPQTLQVHTLSAKRQP